MEVDRFLPLTVVPHEERVRGDPGALAVRQVVPARDTERCRNPSFLGGLDVGGRERSRVTLVADGNDVRMYALDVRDGVDGGWQGAVDCCEDGVQRTEAARRSQQRHLGEMPDDRGGT